MNRAPGAGHRADFHQDQFYFNIPSDFPRGELTALQHNVSTAFSWATTLASDIVRKKVENGLLDRNDRNGESIYRSKVMSTIFNDRSPWFSPSQFSNTGTPIYVKRSDLQAEHLLCWVKQMRPTPPEMTRLLDFIHNYVWRVQNDDSGNAAFSEHYWFSITVYDFNSFTGRIDTDIHIYDIRLQAMTTHRPGRLPRSDSVPEDTYLPGRPVCHDSSAQVATSSRRRKLSRNKKHSGNHDDIPHTDPTSPGGTSTDDISQGPCKDATLNQCHNDLQSSISLYTGAKFQNENPGFRRRWAMAQNSYSDDIVRVDPSFSATQYRFNNDVFERVRAVVEKSITELSTKNIERLIAELPGLPELEA